MKNAAKNSTPNQFELWKAYEDVAMHFNDLIIKLRIQALAALVTFSSIIIVLRETETINQITIFYLLLFILAGWISIWVLDMRYYNRLLEGSVDALLKIEKVSFKNFKKEVENIALSTSIEKAFKKKLNHEKQSWIKDSRNLFYLIFSLAIIIMQLFVGSEVFQITICK